MASEWPKVPIDALKAESPGAIAIGPFGSRMKSDRYTPSGVPVIRGNNLSDTKAFVGDFVYVSPETANELSGCVVYAGDLVFPHRGAIGQVGIVPEAGPQRYILSTSLMKFTCNRRLADPLFLFYFFRSPYGRHQLLKNASTVGTPGIGQPLTSLKSIEVALPHLEEQCAIAMILGSFDDKIELNHRTGDAVEAVARAIFKSWFVDFDPVRAKAEGGQPFGMNAEIAACFPDSMEDSPLGKIPKGWTVARLGDIVEFAYGKPLKEENRRQGNVPVYGSNGLVGWHDEAFAQGPGIVVGRKGNPGIVTWVPMEFWPIDTTFYVMLKAPLASFHYAFHVLSRLDLPSLGADSAVPGLNRNIAYTSQVLLPSPELAKIFDSICEPLSVRAHLSNEESRTLAAIRDALLPKLISGEIRVKEAEKMLKGKA